MVPKKDKAKMGVDMAEATKEATVATAVAGTGAVPSHSESIVAATATAQEAPPRLLAAVKQPQKATLKTHDGTTTMMTKKTKTTRSPNKRSN
jgi:hypothetical protein